MHIRSSLVALALFLVVIIGGFVSFLYAYGTHIAGAGKGVANLCAPQTGAKENPNKMLFISCGGFL